MVTRVSRDGWGAAPPRWDGGELSHPVRYVVLHHTAGPRPRTLRHALELVRGYQRQHQHTNQLAPGGGRDIAYSVLVAHTSASRRRAVVEGRGTATPDGATQGMSGRSISVCLLADFSRLRPSGGLVDTAAHAIADEIVLGRVAWDFVLSPHREHAATACPGQHVTAEVLARIRARAIEIARREERDMPSAQEIAAAVTREATKSGGTMTKWVDERVTSIVRASEVRVRDRITEVRDALPGIIDERVTSIVRSMLRPTAEAVRDIQERVQRLEAQQRLDAEESGGQ